MEKIDTDGPNVSTVKVTNNTSGSLTNVIVSIVPLLERGVKDVDYSRAEVASNAVAARKDLEVKSYDTTAIRTISTPAMAVGDGIVVVDFLYGAIDLQVELKSDEYTARMTFPRGCSRGDHLESEEEWHSVYLMDKGNCIDDSSKSSVVCNNKWDFPERFASLMHNGAVVEVTQIVNNRIILVSLMRSELIEGSNPEQFKINNETIFRRTPQG